jgi:hypothetical protein
MRNCQRAKRDVTTRDGICIFVLINVILIIFFVKFHRDIFQKILEQSKTKVMVQNSLFNTTNEDLEAIKKETRDDLLLIISGMFKYSTGRGPRLFQQKVMALFNKSLFVFSCELKCR